MHKERTRYRKINNLDINTIIILVALFTVCLIFWIDSKKKEKERSALMSSLEEKNTLYKKEALISAKEAVQADIDKFQDEVKERRQELSRLESKLTKREEILLFNELV